MHIEIPYFFANQYAYTVPTKIKPLTFVLKSRLGTASSSKRES